MVLRLLREDNLDAPTNMMDNEGKGKELYDRLTAYKAQIVAVLNPEEFKDQPLIQEQVKKDVDGLSKSQFLLTRLYPRAKAVKSIRKMEKVGPPTIST